MKFARFLLLPFTFFLHTKEFHVYCSRGKCNQVSREDWRKEKKVNVDEFSLSLFHGISINAKLFRTFDRSLSLLFPKLIFSRKMMMMERIWCGNRRESRSQFIHVPDIQYIHLRSYSMSFFIPFSCRLI